MNDLKKGTNLGICPGLPTTLHSVDPVYSSENFCRCMQKAYPAGIF
jgi:hypothetical protein